MLDLPAHVFIPLGVFSFGASLGAAYFVIWHFCGSEFRRNGYQPVDADKVRAEEKAYQAQLDQLFGPLTIADRVDLGARFQ